MTRHAWVHVKPSRDESRRYNEAMEVASLFVYPVKSLRGIALGRSKVGLRGLEWDRHWMVIDENGRSRTQRQIARMAQVATALTDEGLVLSAEGCGAVVVPFEARGEGVEATVWGWTGPTRLVHPKIDRWLSEVLAMPCRLVSIHETMDREGHGGAPVAFPDGGAVLVASEASLDDLNSRLAQPVPMDRFRPNIVLQGAKGFAEDAWASFSLGEVGFRFAKRCGRCLVTTTDQATGERDANEEPLRTLARERLFSGAACFGSFYAPDGDGEISLGDTVKVS